MMQAQALTTRPGIAPNARTGMAREPVAGGERGVLGESVLRAMRDKVFLLCLGFMGNAADARDLTQETFAKALAHCGQDQPIHVQAWIMRIARNTCLDHLRLRRSRGAQQPLSECAAIDWRTPEDKAGREEEIRIIRRAVAALPHGLREVLVMYEYGEMSYKEISRALDIRLATVASRLGRARRAVLRSYQEVYHDLH
jgi:RNA polymerase sigma-70 factor, ECF subfamily